MDPEKDVSPTIETGTGHVRVSEYLKNVPVETIPEVLSLTKQQTGKLILRRLIQYDQNITWIDRMAFRYIFFKKN